MDTDNSNGELIDHLTSDVAFGYYSVGGISEWFHMEICLKMQMLSRKLAEGYRGPSRKLLVYPFVAVLLHSSSVSCTLPDSSRYSCERRLHKPTPSPGQNMANSLVFPLPFRAAQYQTAFPSLHPTTVSTSIPHPYWWNLCWSVPFSLLSNSQIRNDGAPEGFEKENIWSLESSQLHWKTIKANPWMEGKISWPKCSCGITKEIRRENQGRSSEVRFCNS